MKQVPKDATCFWCRWFCDNGEEEQGDPRLGECQIVPPVVVPDGSGWFHSAYPVVFRNSSCSKWEADEP